MTTTIKATTTSPNQTVALVNNCNRCGEMGAVDQRVEERQLTMKNPRERSNGELLTD